MQQNRGALQHPFNKNYLQKRDMKEYLKNHAIDQRQQNQRHQNPLNTNTNKMLLTENMVRPQKSSIQQLQESTLLQQQRAIMQVNPNFQQSHPPNFISQNPKNWMGKQHGAPKVMNSNNPNSNLFDNPNLVNNHFGYQNMQRYAAALPNTGNIHTNPSGYDRSHLLMQNSSVIQQNQNAPQIPSSLNFQTQTHPSMGFAKSDRDRAFNPIHRTNRKGRRPDMFEDTQGIPNSNENLAWKQAAQARPFRQPSNGTHQ
jgi:hypothetical protein